MSNAVMNIWTVYFSPREYPGKFVVRRFDIYRGQEPQPTAEHYVADSLDAIREMLWRMNPNLSCMPRYQRDAAQIVESWL